jgi:hypothetical protein
MEHLTKPVKIRSGNNPFWFSSVERQRTDKNSKGNLVSLGYLPGSIYFVLKQV